MYSAHGNATVVNLQSESTALIGGAGAGAAIRLPGIAAVAHAFVLAVGYGDGIVVLDTAYLPTQSLYDSFLSDTGINTRYCKPLSTSR